MPKKIDITCDLCGKKNAHELYAWFEWAYRIIPIIENAVKREIDGVDSAGWGRHHIRPIYLCEDHHQRLDIAIGDFVNKSLTEE